MSIKIGAGAGAGGGGSGVFPVEVFTGTAKNLVVADNNKFFVMDNVATQTITIPDNPAEPFPIGAEMEFIREGVGKVVFAIFGAVILQSQGALVEINAQYSAAILKKIDTNEWRLIGDLAGLPAFSPEGTAGLKLWADTADLSTIIKSGGFISQWSEKSGNGNHLKQVVGADQPTLDPDGSILFNGVNQFLKADPFTLVQPETIYILFQQVSFGSANTVYDGDTGDTGVLRQRAPATDIGFFAGNTIGIITTFPLGVYGVITAVANGASSIIQLNNEATIAGDSGSRNMNGFTLCQRPSLGRFGNMKIKEVIVYDVAHDALERAPVIDYLSAKGGI